MLCRTSRSSQSAQGGRTRPFRMLAKAVSSDGMPVPYIRHAVSDPFCGKSRMHIQKLQQRPQSIQAIPAVCKVLIFEVHLHLLHATDPGSIISCDGFCI